MSAFLGVRLWQGGELYYNPELLQGFGVANTVGAGGYPNGEAQKSNFPYPRYNTSRIFLRQEIGLGGEREKVEGEYGQLSGEKDVSRVTLQVGKYSVKDLFDANDYAEDPRLDFLNWSIWASGAFDYPADRLGLTWGFTAELNRPSWAVRAGYFLVGDQPNSNTFDMSLFARGGYVGELEMRFKPYDRPGVLRLGSWLTSTFSGSYNQAVALATLSPASASPPTTPSPRPARAAPSTASISTCSRSSPTISACSAASAGTTGAPRSAPSPTSTPASRSACRSRARRGTGRTIASASPAPSTRSRATTAATSRAGGLGVLVGDGAISYAAENVVETYYAFQLAKGIIATADYQFLNNPGYNAVRGPAHFFSGRLSARF